MCKYKAIHDKLGDFKFVTVDDEGLIGSVYFEKGRIRLIHGSAPYVGKALQPTEEMEQMIRNTKRVADETTDYSYKRDDKTITCYVFDKDNLPSQIATTLAAAKGMAENGNSLFEIKKNRTTGKALSRHPSRGFPCDMSGENPEILNALLTILNINFDSIGKESCYVQSEINNRNEAMYRLFNGSVVQSKIHKPSDYLRAYNNDEDCGCCRI